MVYRDSFNKYYIKQFATRVFFLVIAIYAQQIAKFPLNVA